MYLQDDDDSNSDDDDELDLFGEMTEEEKEAKAKKDAVSLHFFPVSLIMASIHTGQLSNCTGSLWLVTAHACNNEAHWSCRSLRLPRNVDKRRLS